MTHRSKQPRPAGRSIARLLLGGALLAVSAQVLAQYVWIDDKGLKQFSDRPPPPSVPDKRILKAPGKSSFDPNAPAEADSAEQAEPKKAGPTLAERNADYNKRQAEAAKQAKKDSEEAQRKADNAANCEAARNNQRSLDQGIRMTTYDQSGQRVIMDDAQRAEAAQKNQRVLANCH